MSVSISKSASVVIMCMAFWGVGCSSKNPSPELVSNVIPTTEPTEQDSVKTPYDINFVMGRFKPSEHPDFVAIEKQYADREGMYMHREAYAAFLRMYAAADSAGIRLVVRSAARNFNYQKGIWERKWRGKTKIENGKDASVHYPDATDRAKMILRFSSMPGTSRHHWGTDIDLNAFNNEWFKSGEGLKVYEWLQANAANFGYCQPYSADRPTGYQEERWHWSYLPIAQPLTRLAEQALRDSMISGFEGAAVAPDVRMVDHYVLGIAEDCLNL